MTTLVRVTRVIVRAVAYEVRTEWAEPRRLAAIHTVTTQQRLSTDIPVLVGKIWPVLREQGVRTGHNVVIYRGHLAGLAIDAGVEVFTEFTGHGEIRPVSTPAGEVATTAHFGDYALMARPTRPWSSGGPATSAARPG